jgi:hypothetical protein
MPDFLYDGPRDARHLLLLAHGAGAPMDSPFMNTLVKLLADRAIRVARFEFDYMAARRTGGKKRPAPKADTLVDSYRTAIADVERTADQILLIGGKSMGGRVASMIAAAEHAMNRVSGLVCIGYPFHPPHRPENLRTAHLETLACPTVILQGERDPFGTRAEVETMQLSPAITINWISDGDHDLGPRGASGHTRKGNLAAAADAVAAFARGLAD